LSQPKSSRFRLFDLYQDRFPRIGRECLKHELERAGSDPERAGSDRECGGSDPEHAGSSSERAGSEQERAGSVSQCVRSLSQSARSGSEWGDSLQRFSWIKRMRLKCRAPWSAAGSSSISRSALTNGCCCGWSSTQPRSVRASAAGTRILMVREIIGFLVVSNSIFHDTTAAGPRSMSLPLVAVEVRRL